MQKHGLLAVLLLVSLAKAAGQVTVGVTLEQDQFLPGESMVVAVRIANHSGRALHLGTTADWLTFEIEAGEGKAVPKLAEAPVAGEFVLESSEIATKRVDISPCFALSQTGRYQVSAKVRIQNLEPIVGETKPFDVVEGATLWEQEFGVPLVAGATNSAPEIRKYILKQANYLPGRLRLHLLVASASGQTLRLTPVGPMLSFSKPQHDIDSASNLHILYQTSAHSVTYFVFSPGGELMARQTYDYTDTRPRLAVGPDGLIHVSGGVRNFTPTDIPTPKFPPSVSLSDEASTSSVPPKPNP